MSTLPNHKHHLSVAAQAHYVDQAAIEATHPLRGNPQNHAAYDAALILVGERHCKGDLAELVGHLLVKLAEAHDA